MSGRTWPGTSVTATRTTRRPPRIRGPEPSRGVCGRRHHLLRVRQGVLRHKPEVFAAATHPHPHRGAAPRLPVLLLPGQPGGQPHQAHPQPASGHGGRRGTGGGAASAALPARPGQPHPQALGAAPTVPPGGAAASSQPQTQPSSPAPHHCRPGLWPHIPHPQTPSPSLYKTPLPPSRAPPPWPTHVPRRRPRRGRCRRQGSQVGVLPCAGSAGLAHSAVRVPRRLVHLSHTHVHHNHLVS